MLYTPDTITPWLTPQFNTPAAPDTRGFDTPIPHGNVNIDSVPTQKGDPLFNDFDQRMSVPDPQAENQPITFNWDQSNIDMYKKNSAFNTYGYDPEIGDRNEKRYWQDQNFGDVTKKVLGGFFVGGINSFRDQLLSWKNTASVFQDPTMQSAFTEESLKEINDKDKRFDQNFHIFSNPDDKGWVSWENIAKGIQSSGNIFGSVAELVAENMAVGAFVTATFGSGSSLAAVEVERNAQIGSDITKNAFRLSQTIDKAENLRNSWNAFKESIGIKNAMNSMENVMRNPGAYGESALFTAPTPKPLFGEALSNLTKSIGGYAGDAISNLGKVTPLANTAKWIGEDVMNPGRAGALIGSLGRGFGAFYSDMRDLNLAVSMAQGNASSTYYNLIQKESDDYKERTGSNPEGIALQQIQDNALAASKKDGALNAFVALYTNKLAFGNILKGNKSIEEALANQGSGKFSNIGVNSERIAKETGQKLFLKDDQWGSFKNSIARGISDLKEPSTYLKAMTHGLGFGLTMSAMETVDHAVNSYFSAKYDNKDLSWGNAIVDSINKEFTPEGAHTFLSGFLTGTIAGPVMDKLGGIQDWFNNRRLQKTQTPETKAQAKDFVDHFNNMWKDPKNPLREWFSDVSSQNKFQSFIKNALSSDDIGAQKSAEDTRNLASKLFILSAAENGFLDIYTEHLRDHISNLSPEELVQAFHPGEKFSNDLYNETVQKISEFEAQSKDIGKIYKDIWKKFPNPYNPSKFKEGTEAYNQEIKNPANRPNSK